MISLEPVQCPPRAGLIAPAKAAGDGAAFAQLVAAGAGGGPATAPPIEPETGDETKDPGTAEGRADAAACAEATDEQQAWAGVWPGLSPAFAAPHPDPGPGGSLQADAPPSFAKEGQTQPAATSFPFSLDDAAPNSRDRHSADPGKPGPDAVQSPPMPKADSGATAAPGPAPAPAPAIAPCNAVPFGIAAAPAPVAASGAPMPRPKPPGAAAEPRPFGPPDPVPQDTPATPKTSGADPATALRGSPYASAPDNDERSRASNAAAPGQTAADPVTAGLVELSPAPALARTGPAPLAEDGLRSAPQPPPHCQIADAVVRSTGGVVEITLAPVELGRLTVVIGTSGAGPRLGVIAERPETLELIRRHSDMLIRDLRDSGLPDAQLTFQRSDAPERPSQAGSTAGWHAPGSTGEQAHGPDTRGGAPGGQSEGESRPRGARRGSADDADQIIPASAPSRPLAGSHGRLDIKV